MRSFAPLILAALASSASAQSFGASPSQPAPSNIPIISGGPQHSGAPPTGSAAFPQGTGGFGGQGGNRGIPSGSSFGGAQPTGGFGGAFQSGAFPSGAAAASGGNFGGNNNGAGSGLPPTGSFPTTFQTRVRPTTSA